MDKETLWGPIRAHLQLTTTDEKQLTVQEQIHWFAKNPAYPDAVGRACLTYTMSIHKLSSVIFAGRISAIAYY